MRMIQHGIFISFLFVLISCSTKKEQGNPVTTEDIMKVEKEFEKMAAEKGIAEAFWFYADSNAVIKRANDTLVFGKDKIRNFYSADFYKTAKVAWTPDFIEVSKNGDFAWTYGKYAWTSRDSSGKEEVFKGVFHSVWKRQEDGSWKYVWD